MTLSQNDFQCATCSDGYAYDIEKRTCVLGCPEGFFNNNGFCFLCRDGKCAGLEQNSFDVRKIASNTVALTQIEGLTGLKTPLSANFIAFVDGAIIDQDYTV